MVFRTLINKCSLAFLALALSGLTAMAGGLRDRVIGKDRFQAPITVGRLETQMDFIGATLEPGISLAELGILDLTHTDFRLAHLRGVNLKGVLLHQVDCTEADLQDATLPKGALEDGSVVVRNTIGPDGQLLNPSTVRLVLADLGLKDATSSSAESVTPSVETKALPNRKSVSRITKAEKRKQIATLVGTQSANLPFFTCEARFGTVAELGLFTDYGPPVAITSFRKGTAQSGVACLLGDRRHLLSITRDTFGISTFDTPIACIGSAGTEIWTAFPDLGELVLYPMGSIAKTTDEVPCTTFTTGGRLPDQADLITWQDGAISFLDLDRGLLVKVSKDKQESKKVGNLSQVKAFRKDERGSYLTLGDGFLSVSPGSPDKGEKLKVPFSHTFEGEGSRAIRTADGKVWLFQGGKLAVIDLEKGGKVQELETGDLAIHELVEGPLGTVWFTEPERDRVCMVSPNLALKVFDLPKGSYPTQIVNGHDGKMYFLQPGRQSLGSIVALEDTRTKVTEIKNVTTKTVTDSPLPLVELKQSEPTEEYTMGILKKLGVQKVGWRHITRRHFFPGGTDRSRFLETNSDKAKVLRLVLEALRADTEPIRNFNHYQVFLHEFGNVVGQDYSSALKEWVDVKRAAVVVDPDKGKLVTTYPLAPYRYQERKK